MGYLSKGDRITSAEQDIIDIIGALGTPLQILRVNAGGTSVEWAAAGAGDVSKVGIPVNNQIGVWTGDGTLEGDAALTFDTTTDTLSSVGLLLSGLTASEIVITDGSKNLVSAAVATYPSLTELAYVKGVTSAIQTQIAAKAPSASPTFTVSITGSYLTASEMLITDGSKNIVSAAVATYPSLTELTYLKGVTSAIQTQFTGKAATTLANLGSVAINTTLVSDTDNTDALGTAAIGWSDIFLGSGAVITWSTAPSTADITLTHSANLLTIDGGNLSIGTGSIIAHSFLADATDGALIEASGGADIVVFGAGNTTNALFYGAVAIQGLLTTSLAGTAVRLVNTTDGASVQVAKFEGDRATMADADEAYNSFILSNDGGTQSEFGRFTWIADDVNAATSIDGSMKWSIAIAGSLTAKLTLQGSALSPAASDGTALGTTALMWSDLFLASGAVIDFNAGAATLTHAANLLTLGGIGAVTLALGTNSVTMTGSIAATGARVTKGWFTDIESTNMPTVGGTAILTSLTAPQFTTIELGAASDTTLSRVSAGVVAVEGVTILTTAGGTLTGSITLGENTGIALDPAGSADGKWSGVTIAGTGGATIAFGRLVYLKAADSRWWEADADATATAGAVMLGMTVTSTTAGAAVTVLLLGQIRADASFPALTIGAPVYAGETAGDIQVAIPTGADNVIRVVGFALTADEIYFNPSQDHQITVA